MTDLQTTNQAPQEENFGSGVSQDDLERLQREIDESLRAKGLVTALPSQDKVEPKKMSRRQKTKKVAAPPLSLPTEEEVKPQVLEWEEEAMEKEIEEALAAREAKPGVPEVKAPEVEAEKVKEAIYKPKFLNFESLQTEDNIYTIAANFHYEDGEMDANQVPWQARLDFWQDLLDKLDSSFPEYDAKKEALETRIKEARKKIADLESLDRASEDIMNRLEETKETEKEERIKDITFSEGVSPSEAEKIAAEEKKEAEEKEKERQAKLQKLGEAQAKLVATEKRLKEYEGLAGVFKGFFKRTEKAAVELEYEEAKKEYEKVRAEFVGSSVEKMLLARMSLADRRARELHEKRGRIYRAWKWLGEQNLEKLMPEKWKAGLAKWRPEGKLGKLAKFTAQFGSKFLSLRTGLSFGLLGIGIWGGVGTATAISLLAARRALAGIGTGFGAYDLMKRGQESWAVTKWNLSWKPWEMKTGLTKEDVEKLSEEEIEERMAHFEMHAALGGHKILENKVYEILLERYRELMEKKAEEKGDQVAKFLEQMMSGADEDLEKMKAKAKRNERIMKGIAVSMGLVAGSGLLAKVWTGKWDWERFEEARAAKQELRQTIGQPSEAPELPPPEGPTEVVTAEYPAEAVVEKVKLPKDFIRQMAGPDGTLTSDETVELARLQANLQELGLNPTDERIINGLGISSFEDIDEVRERLLALSQVTREPRILEQVITRGLDEGDAANLKASLAQVEKIVPSPEARQAILTASIENNFEDTSEMAEILKNVDPEHLRWARILRPDGTIDASRLREIASAQTITINRKGEGIYQALRDYYSALPERGGLGLRGRELRAKIAEQMRNLAFYKNGQLQDLVEVGDKIKVDTQGNVLLFIAKDGKMERARDILDLITDNSFRSGNKIFSVWDGIKLREVAHPVDGHAVIKLTGPDGVTHTISDWSAGETARIDGKQEILEDWLRRNNFLAATSEVGRPVPVDEAMAASDLRRSLQVDEPARLRDAALREAEAVAEGDETAARVAAAEVQQLQESTGLSHDAVEELARSTLSPRAREVLENADYLDKFFASDIEPPENIRDSWNVLHNLRVEDLANYSQEQLVEINSSIEDILNKIPSEAELSPEEILLRDRLLNLQNYIESDLLRGEGIVFVPVEVPPAAPRLEELAIAMPGSRIPFEAGHVRFSYDIFGQPIGVRFEEVSGNTLRARELLRADWEETAGAARQEVLDRAMDLEKRQRLLEFLEEHGRGTSPEAEFLRRSSARIIEVAKEEYGEVFR